MCPHYFYHNFSLKLSLLKFTILKTKKQQNILLTFYGKNRNSVNQLSNT